MIVEAPLMVKPRKPHTEDLPIIAVDANGMAWSDWDGAKDPRPLVNVLTKSKRTGKAGRHPRAMLACVNPARLFLQMHERFEGDPEWNCKVSAHERDHYVNGTIKQVHEITVNFFGWKSEQRRTWYYYVIAPSRYTRLNLPDLVPGDHPEITKLYEWAQSMQAFAQRNKMKLSSGSGGLAAQLLRDPKFYPDARRKVPKATNERVRNALPGNHYELRGVPKRVYGAALYFDQENAHHYAAETTPLPCANELYARGYFQEDKQKLWCEDREEEGEYVQTTEYGLLHAQIWVPKHVSGYLPPWAGRSGIHDAYIYTNELPLLSSLGIEVRQIYASWTAPTRDTGLAKYAQWAQAQIKQYPADKRWLKSVLLSTYGTLASKPRRYEFGFHQANGEPAEFIIGPRALTLTKTQTRKEVQLPVANVIHRGMIEAETRKLSIELARRLESEGHKVLSIYADGVIMKDVGAQMPLLPKPWRAKERLKYLVFETATTFESELLRRRPGVKKGLTKAASACKVVA